VILGSESHRTHEHILFSDGSGSLQTTLLRGSLNFDTTIYTAEESELSFVNAVAVLHKFFFRFRERILTKRIDFRGRDEYFEGDLLEEMEGEP
jgi:hypothetical protein